MKTTKESTEHAVFDALATRPALTAAARSRHRARQLERWQGAREACQGR
jgi:hypothetical protein